MVHQLKVVSVATMGDFFWPFVQKVEDFIKKVRWKAIFFVQGGNQTEPTAHKAGFTFGLNSSKYPP